MSLQVWLPLNNENQLTSQGLMNNTFNKVSSPVYNSSGKIGGCYGFDGTDDNLYSETDKAKYWNGKEISFACWFKCDKVKSGGTIIEIGADLCLSYTYNSSGIRFGYWRCYSNNGSRAGDSQADSHYYSADIWHHIAITFNHQYNKIYVDGNLSAEWDRSSIYTTNWSAMLANNNYKNIAIGRSYGSASFIGGLINDVRIYDHCLSKKEVKEISKALVLHYKLDDISSAYQTLEYIQSSGTQWINTGYVPNANSCVYLKFKKEAIENTSTYYPITCVLGNDSKLYLECFVKGENAWAYSVAGSEYTSTISSVLSMTEVEMSLTQFKVNGNVIRTANAITVANTDCKLLIFAYNSKGTVNNRHMSCNLYEFKCWENINNSKVLKLDLVPAKRISDNAIGMYDLVTNTFFENSGTGTFVAGPEIGRSNIVFDNSGYNHDGTITGSLSVTNDSPRYNLSSKYMNSATSILVGNLSTVVPEKIFTFNIWFKKITGEWSTKGWETIFGGPGGFEFQTKRSSTNSPLLVAYSWGQSSSGGQEYELDKWNMLTIVRTTSNAKFYLNGELYYTGSAGSIPSGNYFIGSWSLATNQNYRGCLSDARIYATALSDQDIKELYDTAAYVDKNGNLECYEIYEEDLGILSTKTGLVKFDNLIEKIDSLYLPAGTWVRTDLNYENSDVCKAITIIRYEANGSGRDLMGYSGSGAGYWGVTANGTWEVHGTMTYTNSDITQINTVVYQFSSSAEHGVYTVGALGSSYSVRNKYIYSVKLYKNGILERDLVPAKNETTCGLLDIISGTFYPCNASNGVLSTNDVETKMFKNHLESNQFLEI